MPSPPVNCAEATDVDFPSLRHELGRLANSSL